MNKLCYKTIFSQHLGTLVAVGEHASSQSKGQGAGTGSESTPGWQHLRFVGILALGFACVSLGWSQTLPQGAQVAQGAVSVSQSGSQMAITQSSPKAVVNWQSFDIGQNAKVNITQPSSQSVLLNRVLSDNPTQILGQLQANGQVVLVNPKGIVVGSDGSVSASAFTASTLNISDADFMAGKEHYTRGTSTGQVINKGRIEVAPGGYVALLGASVSNEGQIIAPQGGVALGAAETVTVPIGRTGRIKLELSPASINASVANQKGGVIVAEGGQVYMQAAALGQAVASVLNSGRLDTSGVQAGAVHLLADGGRIQVDGRITANSSGTSQQGQGLKGGDIYIGRDEETGVLAKATDVSGAKLESAKGFVETSGDVLSTTGTRVKAGEWLLDPYNITIAAGAATGTNYGNYTSSADSTILASDISANLTAGTSVTLATGAGGTSAGNIAVNESISKTGGSDATLTLRAHANITVAASKTITSTTGKLNVVFNSDLDGASGGGIAFGTGSGITSNGGNITLGGGTALNGTGFATADGVSALQGIALYSATINAGGGNISMKGKTAATNYSGSLPTVVGLYMTGGSITTTGSGTIDLSGYNQNTDTQSKGIELASGTITGGSTGAVTITGDSRGLASSAFTYIRGALLNGTVTSTGGDINISGYGGSGAQYDYGVDIGGSVMSVGSGGINITGTAGAGGSGGNVGVIISGSGTISSVDGDIAMTGTGGIGNGAQIRNHGVQIAGTNAIKSTGSGGITLTGTVTNTDNLYSDGVLVGGGGLSTNTGNIKLDGRAAVNYQRAVDVKAAVRSTSGNIYIRSAGANITTTSTGTLSANNISIDNSNGSVDASTGVITPGTAGASFLTNVGSRAVEINGSITAANNVDIYGNHTSSYTGVMISGASTTVSGKNVTIYGKSNTSNGVHLQAATLSGAYIKATGVTNTGYTGFAWEGGNINTTGTDGASTASVIKGISAASSTASNGYGALMMYGNGSVAATSGTTLTLAGEATTSATGQNIKERGILVQDGRTLNMSGDVTLDGTSKSSEGISFGGTVNITGTNSKLTIKGTSAASSNGGLNALNFSGTVNNNGTNTQPITFIGEAKNLSGTNIDKAVNISGTVNGGTANVNVQAKYGKIGISAGTVGAAINGANISIDNTLGTIDTTTGAITEGSGTSNYTNAIDFSGALNATGNINVLGKVATTTNTGINTSATGTITSTGTSASINLASNGNLINAAAIQDTGSTGTGSNINLTSTSGNISGTGAIGDTTNKNANVTFTQGATSIYGGPINAANFTKAGTGALTLDSWVATTPLPSNVSNAYTVKSGSLTLSPGSSYAWLNPASVNVENASVFTLTSNSSSRWHDTAFNFTGGQGGGTMNLYGNPIGTSGTTNTISTSGGATNTIAGVLNANAANVNINLTNATSGTTLADGSFAALVFTQNPSGGYGLGSGGVGAGTVNVSGGGGLLFKDKVKASNLNIQAGTVQFGDGTAATAASTAELQAPDVAISNGATLIFNRAEAHSNTSVFTGPGNLIQAGAGTMTLTGNSSSFAGATTVNAGKTLALGTGGSLGAAGSTVTLVDSASQFHFTGASGVSNVGSTINGAGKVTQSGAGTTILLADNSYAGTTAVSGGTLQVGNAGTTGTLGAGDVTMSNNANLSYVLAEATTITNNISGAGNVSASITGTTSDLTVNRTIALTGGTVNLNADRNLSVTQAISTTNDTSSAVMLVAGKPASAGTATGGDVTISDSGAVTAGTNGRVTYMTGSLAGSTGVGAITGNNRYSSDEVDTNYTAALASGAYTIYREQPLVTVQVNDVSKTYDGLAFTGGSLNSALTSGSLINGDTFAAITANAIHGGSSQGVKNAAPTPYEISASEASGKNALGYAVTYTSGNLTINKANLAITANDVTKTYDGDTNAASGASVTQSTRLFGTDTLSGGTFAFSDKNAGIGNKIVTVSGVTINDGNNGGNYAVTYANNTTSTINKKDVTLASITAVHKTYDGGNTASISSGAITTGVGSETLAISGSGTFSDKHAANGKTVTVADVSALTKTNGIGDWSNYNLTTVGPMTTQANIAKAALTLQAVTDTKTYDGTTSSSGTVVISGNQTGDTITANQIFDSKHVMGTGASTLQVDAITINDGNNGNNYSVLRNNAAGTITKANLAVTLANQAKVYDGTTDATLAAGAITATGVTVAGVTETAAVTQTIGSYNSKNVANANTVTATLATGHFTAGTADLGNYNFPTTVSNTTSTITKANLAVTLANQAKVYDGTTDATLAAGAITATGVTVAGVTETAAVTQTIGSYNSKNVANANTVTATLATGHFTAGTADLGNYNLPTTVSNTTSTITKANLAVTLADQAKVYDGTTDATLAAGAITATGVTVGGVTETAAVTQTIGSYNSKNVASANSKNVASANTVTAILATGHFTAGTADLGNYNLPTTVSNTSSTITQAALTLTANSDLNKVYNGSEQSVSGFTITSGSLRGNDSMTVDLASITAGTQATYAGTHTSTVNDSAYTNGNYAITKVNGTLFIDQKEVSLSATKTYDGNKTLTGTQLSISTGVGSETLGFTQASIHSKNVADNSVNFVDAVSLSNGSNGGLASNYKLPALTAGVNNSVVLTAKALTGSITGATTTYGTATATGAVSLNGKVGTDDVQASSTATLVNAATSTSGQLRAGSYVQTVSSGLTGADAANYSFAGFTTPNANYVVNKLALTGAIGQGLSTYSNNLVTGAVSLTNTVGGDDVLANGVNIDTTGNTSTSGHLKAGVHTGIQSISSLSGADKDNYSFADVKGDYAVNKLALTGNIGRAETTYGANLLAGSVSLTNRVGADVVDASGVNIDTTGQLSTSGHLKAGEHAAIQSISNLSGADKDNYTFANVKGDYQVNKLALTGTIAKGETTYGASLVSGSVSLTNKVGADAVDASSVSIDTTDQLSTSGHLKAGEHAAIQSLNGLRGTDKDNYTFANVKGDYKVNKLALNGAAIRDVSTSYGTQANAGAVSFANVQGNDKVAATAAITGAATSSSGHLKAGNYQQTASTITGEDANNYSFAGFTTSNGNYAVDKKDLVITATAADKVYDATTAASTSLSSNQFSGDSLILSNSSANFSNKNVGNNKAVTITGLTISGTDADNYNLTNLSASTTATIDKKSVTLDSITAANKTYDGNTNATITAGVIGGTAASEFLSVTGNGLFANKNAASGIAVHVQDITALSLVNGTGDWGNYKLTTTGQASTTANITKAHLQAILTGTVEKIYDGTASSKNLNSSHYAVTGWVGSEGASISQTKGSYASKNVSDNSGTGSVSVTLAESDFSAGSGTLLSNYQLPTSATGLVGKITPTTLNIKVNDTAAFVTQDARLAVDQGMSYNGLVNGETAATALSGSPTRTYTGTTYPVAGTYENVYGLSATPTAQHGNYTIHVVQGKLTVVPADKLLIGIGSKTSTYGDLTSSSAGGSADMVTAQYCLSGNCSDGLVNLNVTSRGNGNWLATDNTGTSVTFSTLIDSTGKVSTGGFLNVGNYTYDGSAITPANNSNFNGSVVNGGVLSIHAKHLSLSASNVTKVYDGGTAVMANTLTAAGVMGADSVSANSAGGNFDHKNAGARNYTLTGLGLSGADAQNYAFSETSISGIGTITPKDVNLTAGAVTKTYNGNNQYTVTQSDLDTLSGQLISGDTISAAAINFINKNVSRGASGQVLSNKSVTLDSVSVNDGNNGGNYTVTLAGNSASVITPKTLTATAISDVRTTYGTAAGAGDVSLTGIETGDVVSGLANLVAARYSGSGNLMAGQYHQTTSNELTGSEAGNYTLSNFTTHSANHVVLKKDLVISASATDKVYDTTTLANASLSSDMLLNDNLALSHTGAYFDSKNVGQGKTISISGLTVHGTDADNYKLTNTSATTSATISKANLTLKAVTDTKIYDGTLSSNKLVSVENANGGADTVFAAQEFTQKTVLGTEGSTLHVMPDFTIKDASGVDMSGNYNINTERASGTISPKAIRLNGITALNKTYDGNASAVVSVEQATFNGMVAGDQLTVTSKGSFSDKNAATNKTVSLFNTFGGADLRNYTISDQTWTAADITKKEASIAGTNTQAIYNGQHQVQSEAVLNGFITDDLSKGSIEVHGLASGRHAGRYTSNLSVSGAAALNYKINYQQADLIIEKARLGFTGTQAQDKLVDGTTLAQVNAGSMTGLVNSETLNIALVTGQFNNAYAGTDKPVEVLYRLSNGQNGGLASNYDWSPVVVKANITATSNTRLPLIDAARTKDGDSRLYFQGFGSMGGVGVATGHAKYAIRHVNAQACSPQRLENCYCERLDTTSMEICYPAPPENPTQR